MTNFWLLSGSVENWKHSLMADEHLWGVRDSPALRSIAQLVSRGDRLAFYAARPISGIIGFGMAESERFTGSDPHWPDEMGSGKVLYPHRFKFSIIHVLDEGHWGDALSFKEVGFRGAIRLGLSGLEEKQFDALVQAAERKWNIALAAKFKAKEEEMKKAIPPLKSKEHERIVNMIGEIGRLKGFVVEKEYPLNKLRLDAAWKRVPRGNPHVAFECQMEGNLFEALSKLKEAWDIWRSVPILVTTDEWTDKATQLVHGSFHEIRDRLKITTVKDIEKLYEAWKKVREIEGEITLSEL